MFGSSAVLCTVADEYKGRVVGHEALGDGLENGIRGLVQIGKEVS